MASEGDCDICREASAQRLCERCERTVCKSHYEPQMEFCAHCTNEALPEDAREGMFRFKFS